MVMPVPARQDLRLVPRQELHQRSGAMSCRADTSEQAQIEHVRQFVESSHSI
jgi:hypothetical protein